MYRPSENRYEKMKFKKCGNSGLKMPIISLGLWHNFGETGNYENMKKMCFTAFDNGITQFDIANNYGPMSGDAELNFGKILKQDLIPFRDEMIITTKAGYYMWPGPYGDGGSRKYLLSSLDQSLTRLGLDYVDIFYHHRMDKDTPLEESMMALDHAVKSGKALYAGISNYDGETMVKATEILNELKCPFVINQNCYNIFDRTIEKNGLLNAAKEKGKGVIVFSPLAQGLLTNRYVNGIPEDSRVKTDGRFLNEDRVANNIDNIIKLNDLAMSRGQSLAQMALQWVLKDDTVTSVLIGASQSEQILDNLKILESAPFTDEELKMIDEYSL